jgi:hypothetical protein
MMGIIFQYDTQITPSFFGECARGFENRDLARVKHDLLPPLRWRIHVKHSLPARGRRIATQDTKQAFLLSSPCPHVPAITGLKDHDS